MRKILKSLSLIYFLFLIVATNVHAQYEFEDLDGVKIKAIEEYPSIKTNEYTVGFTALPFDPYYYGYGLNLGFNRYFNKKWGWNVVDLIITSGAEKPLTTGLAEKTALAPVAIEKVEFLLASNAKYVLSYGKSIFFDKYIRLTRTEFIFGLGGMSTSEQTLITLNLGIQLDFVMSEKFSWKVEFINYYPPGKNDVAALDYAAIGLKSAWRF